MRTAVISALVMTATWIAPAHAEGILNIYNWGNYTNPKLIEKFEKQYGVKVTMTDYDSNEGALAKIKAGGHGFDMVVPSGGFIQAYVAEGLLMKSEPNTMENFKNVEPRWVDVEFDKGRHYTVPWHWGTNGLAVNTGVYSGDIGTLDIILNPPKELDGRINVFPDMGTLLPMVSVAMGGEQCTSDPVILKKVRDALVAAKPHWRSMEYGALESFVNGDYDAALFYNGPSMRARLMNPKIKFALPRSGFKIWMDNLAILADAENVDNAKLFMNFMMAPENAALNSNFTRYSNGIAGAEAFMDKDLISAPELAIPDDLKSVAFVEEACSPEVMRLYSAIWTELQQ